MNQLKGVAEIVDSASNEQVRSWLKAVRDGKWPADMEMPREAFRAVWYTLTMKELSLTEPDKKTKKKEKA